MGKELKKKTMAKYNYYVVNVMASLDNLLFADFRDQIIQSLQKYSKVIENCSLRMTE